MFRIVFICGALFASSSFALTAHQAHLLDDNFLNAKNTVSMNLSGPLAPIRRVEGVLQSSERRVLALVLGLIVGFGTGHLIAGDMSGFVLFLVVDIAIIVASGILSALVPFGSLGFIALVVSHVIQGIDAYAKAGGERIIELTREQSLRIAAAGTSSEEPFVTRKLINLAF